jgi:hypothetical protein
MVPIAVIIGIILLGTLGFVYYANDMNENITVAGEYSDMWGFMTSMNVLIALLMSNLGYVLAIVLIIGAFLASIAYVGYKAMYG